MKDIIVQSGMRCGSRPRCLNGSVVIANAKRIVTREGTMRVWLVKGNEHNGHAICNIDGPVPAIGEFIEVVEKREYEKFKQKYLWLKTKLGEHSEFLKKRTIPVDLEDEAEALLELIQRAESS